MRCFVKKTIMVLTALVALTCAAWTAPAGPARAAEENNLQYGAKRQLAPGVVYYPFTYQNWAGGVTGGHITEITPGGELLEIRPALGEDRLGGREKLSSMAARHGAVAAINGGFFDGASGNPIGGLVVDGAVQYHSDLLRTSLGWSGKGSFAFGYFSPPGAVVTAGGQSFSVKAFNRLPGAGEVALFTPLYKGTVGSANYTTAALQKTGGDTYRVIEGTAGTGGYALVFGADQAHLAGFLKPGDELNIKFDPGTGFAGLDYLVTGGPLLVEGGIPVFMAVNEGFRGSVLAANARTAVGVRENGHVLLVVVDKAKPASGQGQSSAGSDEAGTPATKDPAQAGSQGLTLDELAWLMARLGAVRAAALDGGGSSEMWVGGKVISRPSDGSERPLANALLVLYQVPTYLDGQRVFFDVAPLVEKGRSYAPLRGIFELLGAKVNWDSATGTITAVRGERTIRLSTGKQEAFVNDRAVVLDASPLVVNGRTMVPVRFISESLGAGVHWQSNPKGLYIKSPSGEVSQ